MANYRLTRVSDTLHRVSLGRETIGWARPSGERRWRVSTARGDGVGSTPTEAFRDFVRERNNKYARDQGYADARDMVQKQNDATRAYVDEWNKLAGDLMPMRLQRGRRVIT